MEYIDRPIGARHDLRVGETIVQVIEGYREQDRSILADLTVSAVDGARVTFSRRLPAQGVYEMADAAVVDFDSPRAGREFARPVSAFEAGQGVDVLDQTHADPPRWRRAHIDQITEPMDNGSISFGHMLVITFLDRAGLPEHAASSSLAGTGGDVLMFLPARLAAVRRTVPGAELVTDDDVAAFIAAGGKVSDDVQWLGHDAVRAGLGAVDDARRSRS